MMKATSLAWQTEEQDNQEVRDFIYDPNDEEDASEPDVAVVALKASIQQFGTSEEMVAYYEIVGDG